VNIIGENAIAVLTLEPSAPGLLALVKTGAHFYADQITPIMPNHG